MSDVPPGSTTESLTHLARSLERRFGDRFSANEPIGARTTYRVGGRAELFVRLNAESDLELLEEALEESGGCSQILVLGNGSNLLVSDAGIRGLVVTLSGDFETISIHGSTVTAGASAPLPIVSRKVSSVGLSGYEWAVGVPGTVGGSVVMNAGGHGSDTAAVLRSVRLVHIGVGTSGVSVVPASSLELAYRRSNLTPSDLVISAELELHHGDPMVSKAEISEIVRWRREHQPGGQNAGSVFANPEGDKAAALIEGCSLKGMALGSASVSTKHANFIQSVPGGRADDVRKLILYVQKRVFEERGVLLRTEIRMVGFSA